MNIRYNKKTDKNNKKTHKSKGADNITVTIFKTPTINLLINFFVI